MINLKKLKYFFFFSYIEKFHFFVKLYRDINITVCHGYLFFSNAGNKTILYEINNISLIQ